MAAIALNWLATHWVDLLSVVTGFFYAKLMRGRAAATRALVSRDTALDFLSGLALAPLGLLFLGAFSEDILQALIRTNAVILAGASVVALFSICEHRDG